MRGIETAKVVPHIVAASSTKIAIEGKLFHAIRTHPDEIRLHPKLRLLRLQPGDMCWCRVTDIPRLSSGGWRPVIVEADNGELAVFTDMTSQLAFMNKRAIAASPRSVKGIRTSEAVTQAALAYKTASRSHANTPEPSDHSRAFEPVEWPFHGRQQYPELIPRWCPSC